MSSAFYGIKVRSKTQSCRLPLTGFSPFSACLPPYLLAGFSICSFKFCPILAKLTNSVKSLRNMRHFDTICHQIRKTVVNSVFLSQLVTASSERRTPRQPPWPFALKCARSALKHYAPRSKSQTDRVRCYLEVIDLNNTKLTPNNEHCILYR